MAFHRSAAAGAALLALVAVGACSSSKSSSSTSTGTPATTSSAPATTAAPRATVAPPATAAAPATGAPATTVPAVAGLPTQTQAQSAMLVAADVTGYNLTDGQFTPPDPSQPLPCGQPDPDSKLPPALQVGAEIDSASPQAAVIETLAFYTDTATATQAFNLGLQGVSCASATLTDNGGTIPIQLTSPSDVTSQVGGDKAIAVQIKSAQFQAVVVGVTKDNAVLTFQYQTVPDADTTKLPNPIGLAALGVQKIAKILGG